ncbi:MAG: PAS domain S-box protein [Bacteroidota bacterium]|nr:PAS domain S-box protein [Bacteroidota bacterium]
MNKTKEALSQELAALKQDYARLKSLYEKEINARSHNGNAGTNTESAGNVSSSHTELSENSGQSGDLRMPDGQSVQQLFHNYLKMYASRDDTLTNLFSDDFSGFTGGGDFLVKDKKEWVAITRQDFAQVKAPLHIELKDLSVQSLSDTIAVTTGFFTIHLPFKDHILSRETARLVLIFRKEAEAWKISHSSISIPYYLVREGEVYPLKELVERNKALEETVEERTIQLSEANDKLKKANEELAKEIAGHMEAERELRKSEQKYRLLVESANEAIVVIQHGMLRLVNPMTFTMTGYTQEEIEKIPFIELIHPEEREQHAQNHRNRLRGETVPSHFVFRLLKKDGSIRWIYLNAVLIDWEGVPATLNFLTDVTENKMAQEALEQSNRKLEAVIAATPDGIGIISLDGKMQFMSDKLILMYGYSIEEKDELIGRYAFDFIDPSDQDRLADNMRKLIAGQSDYNIREYLAVRKDNSRFYIELNYTVLSDSNGNPASILFVERDYTVRKRAQEDTIKMNLELAELIATKDKFFSIIAHDLKSPFQGLMGCSNILATEYDTLSEEEKISFIGSIEELSRSSYKLLENLLDWSRLQTGQMTVNFEDFNLLVELYPTISLVKQTARNKNIDFNYIIDKSVFIKADRNMLSAIIRNLVANSIKFTKPGGSITLEARKLDDFLEVSVTDTGVGIEQDVLNNLFKIDKSVSRKGTANEEGTGLGLLLCKEMVEKHGGRIRVESKVGHGSTFSFTIH